MAAPLVWRLVVEKPDALVPFTPGEPSPSDEHFVVTSIRNGTRPYIASPPNTDGQELDFLTGRVIEGKSTLRVIDVPEPVEVCALTRVITQDALGADHLQRGWRRRGHTQGSGYPNTTPAPADPAGLGGFWPVPYPWLNGHVLAFWVDDPNPPSILGPYQLGPTVRDTWTELLMDGTENGGSGFVPGEVVGIRIRSDWPLDTGPGQIFLEANGNRVVLPNGGYNFWTMDPALSPYIRDHLLTAVADQNGQVLVKFGGVGYGPGSNVFAAFSDLEVYGCVMTQSTDEKFRYVTARLAGSDARQELLDRRSWIELSRDNGVTWRTHQAGYLTALRMPKSLVYDFTVGDSRRIERLTKLSTVTPNFHNVACVIGGPLLEGLSNIIPFKGRPTFVVQDGAYSTYEETDPARYGQRLTRGYVILRYVGGPMPLKYLPTGDSLDADVFQFVNERARGYWTRDVNAPTGFRSDETHGSFPRLRVEIFGTWPVTERMYKPYSWQWISRQTFSLSNPVSFDALISAGSHIRIAWDYKASDGNLPAIGSQVQVAIYPIDISRDASLLISMHPVDIVRFLFEDYAVPYDLASYQATRAALGDHLLVRLRITDPPALQTLIEELQAAFGFGTRVGQFGRREFFEYRRKRWPTVVNGVLTPPIRPIVHVNTLRAEGGPTYELEKSSKCNQLRFTERRLVRASEDHEIRSIWDMIEERERTAQVDLIKSFTPSPIEDAAQADRDAAQFGTQVQEYSLRGQLEINGIGELDVRAYARGVAERVFDRFGRGAQMTTAVCLRDSTVDDVAVGDEVLLEMPHQPNAQFGRTPSSQRGGTRVGTVVKRSEHASGPKLTFVDAGTGTVPFDIAPNDDRWALTLHPTDSRIALLDLDLNGYFALLLTAGARVAIQIFFGPSAPTVEGVEYTVVDPRERVTSLSGDVDPVFALGPFVPANQLWVRIQPFIPGAMPAQWSNWKSVGTSSSGGTISSLVVQTVTQFSITDTWTNTNTTDPVTAEFRVAGSTDWILAAVLPPGSTQYTLTGLTPGVTYERRYSLPDGTTLTSSDTTATGTAGQLQAPINPIAFAGSWPGDPAGQATGIFGLQVTALDLPSTVVFEVATETAIGSGSYGTYVEFARTPAVVAGPTFATTFAPSDGLRRALRAKLTRSGWQDSPYSVPVVIDPWAVGTVTPPNTTPSTPAAGTRQRTELAVLALGSGSHSTGTLDLARGTIAYRVKTNVSARVRLYVSAAARDADVSRAIGTDPKSGEDGCLMDVVLAAANGRDLTLAPPVVLGSPADPPVATLYSTVTNLMASTRDVLVEIWHTPTEP